MVPDYAIAIEEYYPADLVVIMLGVASGTYSNDGQLHPENRWQTPLPSVRVLIEDGLVAEWRVYADNAPIRKLLSKNLVGLCPHPSHKFLRLREQKMIPLRG